MSKTPSDQSAPPPTRLKRSRASLFGGVATAIGVFILYVLLTGAPTVQSAVVGLLIGAVAGAWVRLADL